MTDDRAVSEVLGYVMIIAIVVVTIAVIMTFGIGGLEASQEGELVNNMERAFDVLAYNTDAVIEGKAPSRATELRLGGGALSYGTPVEINVTQDGTSIGNITIGSEPIIFESNSDTQIIYEAGAVFRTDGDRTVMLREPPFVLHGDHLVIHGVSKRPLAGTLTEISRDGTVLVRSEGLSPSYATTNTNTGSVNITVTSPRAEAWESYFAAYDIGTSQNSTDNQVRIRIDDADTTVTVLRSRIRTTISD